MRKENSDFKTAFLSEAGSQLDNRDYHGYIELDDYACWVVADGIDECETKKSAEMIVKDILETFKTMPGNSKSLLRDYLTIAHNLLQRESIQVRLKASIMVVVTDYRTIRYASAGNIHLQIFSKNRITLESQDQSYYQQKVDDETFPTDRSQGFEERNNLTTYMGMPERFRPYISKKHKLQEMDVLVITTVGLWEHVTNIELLDGVEGTTEPGEVVDNLEDLLLSKQLPSLNNYTMAVIFVNKLFQKQKKWWPIIKKILIILIPLLIILGIWGFFAYRAHRQRVEIIYRIEGYQARGNEHVENESFYRALEQYNEAVSLLSGLRARDFDCDNLRRKQRVTELIVDGRSSLEREDLERARNYYTRARNYLLDYPEALRMFRMGYATDQINYIRDRIYLEELIALGDMQVQFGQYEEAVATYLQALRTALNIGRQEAMQTIDVRLQTARSLLNDAELAELLALADEEYARIREQERNLDPQATANLFEELARKYEEAGLSEEAARMRTIAAEIRTDAVASQQAQQEDLAAGLEERGDAAWLAGDLTLALSYFQAAERILRDIGSDARLNTVTQKIISVNELIEARRMIEADD